MKADNEIGLVLSGGGAKGAYQIGVLKAMAEYNILDNITSVSGTSVGGINAAMLLGLNDTIKNNIVEMEKIWRDFDYMSFAGIQKSKEKDINWRKLITVIQIVNNVINFDGGWLDQCVIGNLIDTHINFKKICTNIIDCYITCHKFWFIPTEKSYTTFHINDNLTPCHIKKIILASAAMPFLYTPIEIGGIVYDDGGTDNNITKPKGISNIPYKIICDKGYKNIVIVNLDKEITLKSLHNSQLNVIEIKPKNINLFDTTDFNKIDEWINLGYNDAINQFVKNSLIIQKLKEMPVSVINHKRYKWGKSKPINDIKDIINSIRKNITEISIHGRYAKIIFDAYNLNDTLSDAVSAAVGLLPAIHGIRKWVNSLFIKYDICVINENEIILYLKKIEKY